MSAHRAARLPKWRLQAGLTPQGFSSPPRTGASRLSGCKKPQRDPPQGGDAAWGHHSLGSPLRVSEILLGKLEHCVRWESQAVLPAVCGASPDWGTLQEGRPPHPAQSEQAQRHPWLTVPRPSRVGPLPPQWPGPADLAPHCFLSLHPGELCATGLDLPPSPGPAPAQVDFACWPAQAGPAPLAWSQPFR